MRVLRPGLGPRMERSAGVHQARRPQLHHVAGTMAAAGAVLVVHGGQGDGILDPSAYPNGRHLSLTVARDALAAGWESRDRGGRREQVVSVEASVPWSGANRVGLRAEREITGSVDRAAAWSAGVFWRLEPRPVVKTARAPRSAAR